MGRTLYLFISDSSRKHEFTLFAVEQTLSKESIMLPERTVIGNEVY